MADPKDGYDEGVDKIILISSDETIPEPKEGLHPPDKVVIGSITVDGDFND